MCVLAAVAKDRYWVRKICGMIWHQIHTGKRVINNYQIVQVEDGLPLDKLLPDVEQLALKQPSMLIAIFF